jgi:hypothetical protein
MDIGLGMQLKTWAKLRRDSAAFMAEVHMAEESGRRGEDVPWYDEKLGSLVRVFSSERKVDPGNKLVRNKGYPAIFRRGSLSSLIQGPGAGAGAALVVLGKLYLAFW